ncbi:HTH-type transcriptional repressor of iron protein A [Halomonas elongata]|uniref:HTH-type transcriptional repressor of iron protein A n=1 Tax=Halomonas elongata TaxID=2746 RepID=A0A1B8P073_HALEL|nr:helix-turn-helix transcriptional regulator [Halomonas elongata]OBX35603.1 HTH-type transcriptional repressor of iron protein A [Halomonas elongata]
MPSPLIPSTLAASPDGPSVIAVMLRSDALRVTQRHRHARGQLLGSSNGLVSVETDRGQWVVPATHAVWVPPGIVHGLRSHGPFAGWSAYVAPASCTTLPDRPCILPVSGLLREVVARLAQVSDHLLTAAQQRLAEVLMDEIGTAPHDALGLPMPTDPRVRKVARALSECPDDSRRLEEWAAWVDIAPRTLSRRFVKETGFTLTEWRQRVRLLRAMELLAAGYSVTRVALELGYDNTSAFIALFRRRLGTTPGQFASTGRLPSPGQGDSAMRS